MSLKNKKKKTSSDFDFSVFDSQLQDFIRQRGGAVAAGGDALVQELVARTYQALLDAELEEHLEDPNSKHSDSRAKKNTRNGRGSKRIRGDFGEVEIKPPRDRAGTFEPELVKKRSSTVGNFTDKIISLYARGMTTREISEHLHEIYQIELSESFVSRAVSTIQEQVDEWQQRPLDELYCIVYIDGIRFNVRSDNGKIIKKCFYTVLGIPLNGKQDVLGMWIADNEGASFWLSVLTDLKTRGVQDVLIFCSDGLTGLPDAVESAFPQADMQLCIVHQIRNCTRFVSYKDRKAICADMRKIYEAASEKSAQAALGALQVSWGKQYPAVIKSWQDKWELLTKFLDYPVEVRKITYTTNAIEALHALFRKNTKNRRIFPNDDSLFRLLFLNIRNLSKKWTTRQGWGMIVNQLSILFGDRITKFLTNGTEI